ncbi:hypothetical protein HJC23_000424 [Cyclotella cryptica]|uniref:Calmodulin n=1 Tax=Cyclotella cryptica TaxID=29204 RepID=A0ABD3QBJ8_9STRA
MASAFRSHHSKSMANKNTPSFPKRHLLLPFLGLTTLCNVNVVAFQSTTFSAYTPIPLGTPPRSILSSRLFAHSTSHEASSNEAESTLPQSEITTLFQLLRDTTILYDPSRGTCCRNKCSGCTYLDSNGNFLYDEYTATKNSNNHDGGGVHSAGTAEGWIAPYVKVDFGDKVHTSTWSTILFPLSHTELERNQLETTLLSHNMRNNSEEDGRRMVSPLAIKALWNTLSPSVGYPRLTSTEVVRAIRGMDGARYEMGGAVDYASFCKAMMEAAAAVVSLNTDNVNGDDGGGVVDYDALSKEELLTLVEERGMKTTFPKMKRIIIEELRFFDANGRQGKRHPVKNTLS